MSQENENKNGRIKDQRQNDEPGIDAKKEENLENLIKVADNMPELKNDPNLFEDEQIQLDMCEPPPEVMEYARRELGETEEVKCQMLQEFRDMIYGKR